MDSQIVFRLLINISIVFSPVFFQFVCSSPKPDNFIIHLPLYPHIYGIHYLYLRFGTPPVTLSFVMDTGNSTVYSQCSSVVDSKNNILIFPETSLDNFIFQCSNNISMLLGAIAGFGRANNESLPAQMELDSFSYCMLSHDFDTNRTNSGYLVLTKGGKGGSNGSSDVPTGEIVHYTPFVPNPESWPDYYYVRLQNIKVGNVNITVPNEYQVPDEGGDGGTIVNSGTPYNFIDGRMFYLFADEFVSQVTRKNSNNIRNRDAEYATGFGLCFNVASFDDIPKLSLHFDGGAAMDLPLGNYFKLISHIDELPYLVCMMTNTRDFLPGGPTIVLGNYIQQNFYIHFDLKNNRLGLLSHTCTQK